MDSQNLTNRRIKPTLRGDFEASVASSRASVTGWLFGKAVYIWASDLTAANSVIPKALKNNSLM